ncbi:MAG: ribose-phosphate pyrophosphokinae [Abditibacteriota bacterium]|nr:ribose-phosphate pyrophosphokinae [Abditibacteriota bacterium]
MARNLSGALGPRNWKLKVFSGNANPELAREVCEHLGEPPGRATIQRFSNENIFVQIEENVREADVYVIQPFSSPVHENIMELLIMMDALRSASARRITAVIPYYSYARSDKKDAPRISITGRLMADLLVTSGANRVLTMTLHAPQVHGFFSVPTDHLVATPILADHFKHMSIENAVVVAPDAGHAKRAGEFAQFLKLPIAFVDKRRVSDHEVEATAVVGDVRGKNCLVVDDEIAAASTTVSTAQALLEHGAREVYAAATHGVLCGPAISRLEASPIHHVAVTNTVGVAPEKRIAKLEVLSVAPLFANAIKSIHTGESISALFG